MKMTTKNTIAGKTAKEIQVVLSERYMPVKDVNSTVKKSGYRLATFKEAVNARIIGYDGRRDETPSIAVAPHSLPKKEGWYRVNREPVSLMPLDVKNTIISEASRNNVFYFTEDAIGAAKSSRLLRITVLAMITYVHVCPPEGDFRLALVKLDESEKGELLRT